MMLSLAKRTAQRTQSPFAYTMEIAAIANDLPTWDLPMRLELIFFDQKPRCATKVGVMHGRGGIPVHRFRRPYPAEAISQVDGLPVLSVPYLLLEFCSLRDLRTVLVTGDALVRQYLQADRQLSQDQLDRFISLKREVQILAQRYLEAPLAQLVSENLALLSPLAESPLESLVRADLLSAGIQDFIEQFPILSEGGKYFADFYLRSIGVILECDGDGKYVLDPDKVHERQRQADIEELGFKVIRVSWEEAQDPYFVRRLVGALEKIA
ncbi:MAG: DUF559 domain-containing protein [Actinomycetaceae bacterium]|nr:DUF559 domain-containing protein [Actinomycetaceae bacterium]